MRLATSGTGSGAHHHMIRQQQLLSGAGGSAVAPTEAVGLQGRSEGAIVSSAATKEEVVELDDPVIEELLESVNRRLITADKRLQFLIHEETGRVQLKVVERFTGEVIREVPPEKLLDLVARIHELIGLLIDETV